MKIPVMTGVPKGLNCGEDIFDIDYGVYGESLAQTWRIMEETLRYDQNDMIIWSLQKTGLIRAL